MTLRGKVCVITGAGSGIGKATAIRFAKADAKVFLLGRTGAKVDSVRAEIEHAGGSAAAHEIDVSDRDRLFRARSAASPGRSSRWKALPSSICVPASRSALGVMPLTVP